MARENICLRSDVTIEITTMEKDHLKVRKQMRNRPDTCNKQAILATCVRSHEQVKAFLSTLLNSTSFKHLFIHIPKLRSSALILFLHKILKEILYQKIS